MREVSDYVAALQRGLERITGGGRLLITLILCAEGALSEPIGDLRMGLPACRGQPQGVVAELGVTYLTSV